jgi:hypothetical protein
MSSTVWISTAMADPSNLRPLTHDLGETEMRDAAIDWGTSNNNGDPMGAEFFPKEIWSFTSAEEKDYKLPHIFRAGTFWVVSAAAAAVLRQFDLGQGALYPVKVFKKDRETPIGDGWFCINFGNQKSAFLPQETVRARKTYIRDGGVEGWTPRLPYNDNDFTVSTAALPGPDIWIDPKVGDAFFLSDALANALKKAKVHKGFSLNICRVI